MPTFRTPRIDQNATHPRIARLLPNRPEKLNEPIRQMDAPRAKAGRC